MNKEPVHNKIQFNGVCWDCGADDAKPTYEFGDHCEIKKLGWTCKCGRWWPVCSTDILNWADKIKDWPFGTPPDVEKARKMKQQGVANE